MDAFVPELSQLWFASRDEAPDERVSERTDAAPSPSQLEALEELNERIHAARCVY